MTTESLLVALIVFLSLVSLAAFFGNRRLKGKYKVLSTKYKDAEYWRNYHHQQREKDYNWYTDAQAKLVKALDDVTKRDKQIEWLVDELDDAHWYLADTEQELAAARSGSGFQKALAELARETTGLSEEELPEPTT